MVSLLRIFYFHYEKYNFLKENLEYFTVEDEYYWYEGKKLNDSYKPDVYILPDRNKKGRKMIIYECKLPKSDVYLSLKPTAARSSHSYPLPPKRVTVSALHLSLNLVPFKGINVKLKKSKYEMTTTKQSRFVYSEYSSVTSSKNGNHNNNELMDNPDRKNIDRFMIFYDGKCRDCFININNMTIDSNQLINPTFFRSVKCHLKVCS